MTLQHGSPTLETVDTPTRFRSLTVVLWFRAIYSAYARFLELVLAITGGASLVFVAAILPVLLVLPIADAFLSTLGIDFIAGQRVGHLDYAAWSSYLIRVLRTLAIVILILPGVAIILRNLRADSLLAISLVLVTVPALGYLAIKFEIFGAMRSNDFIGALIFTLLPLTLLVLLHLVCAIAVRLRKDTRLAAAVPLSRVHSLYPLELLRSRHQCLMLARGFLRMLLSLSAKSTGLFVIVLLAYGLFFLVSKNSGQATPDTLFIEKTILVLAIGAAALRVLIDLVRRPHVRALNVLLLCFLLDKMLGATLDDLFLSESWKVSLLFCLVIILREWLFSSARDFHDRLLRLRRRSASRDIASRGRPPILFLRSFQDDYLSLSAAQRMFDFVFGGNTPRRRLEEVVTETLSMLGPVVAMDDPGKPGQFLQGASRDDALASDWRSRVSEYIDSAQLIVVIPGATAGIEWEMEEIVRRGALSKMLVVLPPGRNAAARPDASNINVLDAGIASLSPTQRSVARVILWAGEPPICHAIGARHSSERGYVEALRVGAGQSATSDKHA